MNGTAHPWPGAPSRALAAVVAALAAACAAPTPPTGAPTAATPAAAPAGPRSSPECEAAKLKAVDPLPVAAIPPEVLRRAQSGWVAVRYDVVRGKAQNLEVVASQPPGLYDAIVLRHTAQYAEPTGATVRGCLATTNIRF